MLVGSTVQTSDPWGTSPCSTKGLVVSIGGLVEVRENLLALPKYCCVQEAHGLSSEVQLKTSHYNILITLLYQTLHKASYSKVKL